VTGGDEVDVRLDRLVVDLRAGEQLEFAEAIWQDTIVFVVSGALDVQCSRGECHSFRSGDVLSFARVALVAVRGSACGRTRLLAIRRTTSAGRGTG
jgi:glyoxylate utilization-related uncharacterized protein